MQISLRAPLRARRPIRHFSSSPLRRVSVIAAMLVAFAIGVPSSAQPARTAETGATARARAHFDSIRMSPPQLRAFLGAMPKGADLHNHLSGAVYAERYIEWAAAAGACINTATWSVDTCDPSAVAAQQVLQNPVLYRQVVDAWSMRNWQLSGQSGHDHFFDTFGRFGAAGYGRTGDMLADVAQLEQSNGVGYAELMLTFDNGAASRMGRRIGFNGSARAMRDKLLAAGFRDTLRAALPQLDSAEARMRALLDCDSAMPSDACAMTIRYLYQVGRGGSPEQVCAQIIAGFEFAEMDHRAVGFNLVQPEDYPVPLRDFSLQMRMIDELRPLYHAAHISLHAGELAPGLAPPEELRFHIRSSIDTGHAERIGHGVAVMSEDRPEELLRAMARRGTLVEVCLTSNDVILGVSGSEHPLATYLRFGVPVALATDDPGVSRGDMTREFERAVEEQGLGYDDLKRLARNSLEYSFAEGKSLWSERYVTVVPECRGGKVGDIQPGAACRAFLAANTKARLEWELEAAFLRFEAGF